MGNCKLQFPGHHSYFRKDFQMLLAVNEGEIYRHSVHLVTHSNNKTKKINFKNLRPTKPIYVAPPGIVCVVRVKHRFQQSFSHITTVSGCNRELNAHFYSAASLWFQVPDTLLDITPSHIMPSGEQLVPLKRL